MDILSIIGTFFRRWYLSLPIVLVALVAAFIVQSNVEPELQANGSVMLANPELDPARLPLTLGDIDTLVAEVQRAADSGDFGDDLSFEVRRVDQLTLELTFTATAPSIAEEAIEAAAADLSARLSALQQDRGVPPDERTEVLQGATELSIQQEFGEELLEEPDLEEELLEDRDLNVVATVFLSDPTLGVENPFGASSQTARVLEVTLNSDEGRRRLRDAAGRQVMYLVSQSQRDSVPILDIATLGSTPEVALGDFDLVVDELARELELRQNTARVPESRRVFVEVLAAPQQVEDVSPPISRLTAAVVALGGLLALGLTLLVESIARRRAAARSHSGPETPGTNTPVAPAQDDAQPVPSSNGEETSASGTAAPSAASGRGSVPSDPALHAKPNRLPRIGVGSRSRWSAEVAPRTETQPDRDDDRTS